MAYKTKKLYDEALRAIDENNLFFVDDVCAYLGINRSTFYKHFPIDSNKSNAIKDKLSKNKMRTKVSIRSKLHKSQAPAALLALYKLLATEDERRALSMEYKKHTVEVEQPLFPDEDVED